MTQSTDATLEEFRRRATQTPPDQLATDEAFWARVAEEFVRPADFIHLEYGYYHPSFRAVLETEVAAVREANCRGSHYKRTEMARDVAVARADLARLAGAAPDEILITRNASESLNLVIQGLHLAAGDEVVFSTQDYGSMCEAWEQRARREPIVLRPIDLPFDPASDDDVIACFTAATTPRTRVWHLTHVLNLTGQVLPVAKLCAVARARGIATIVDAAHGFGLFESDLTKLGADYVGSSLHKWLAAPLGTGLLYVRRGLAARLWPLYGDSRRPADDIEKLDHVGNRPDSAHRGLRAAIRWHSALGAPVKLARLRHLQSRWSDHARTCAALSVLTPRDPARRGAIAAFALPGIAPSAVVDYLMREQRIFVNAFTHPTASGVRVTPGLATSAAQIDHLIAALDSAIRHFVR